jgi:hypothetical protein
MIPILISFEWLPAKAVLAINAPAAVAVRNFFIIVLPCWNIAVFWRERYSDAREKKRPLAFLGAAHVLLFFRYLFEKLDAL